MNASFGGSRKWDKTKAGLVTFLFGVMRSICNAWFRAKQDAQPNGPPSPHRVLLKMRKAIFTTPSTVYAAQEPTTEELLVFRETLLRIDDVLSDDQEARMILEGFREGLEPPAIRELWEFSQTQYDTIITRMRRKLKKARIVQPQQGATHVQ